MPIDEQLDDEEINTTSETWLPVQDMDMEKQCYVGYDFSKNAIVDASVGQPINYNQDLNWHYWIRTYESNKSKKQLQSKHTKKRTKQKQTQSEPAKKESESKAKARARLRLKYKYKV